MTNLEEIAFKLKNEKDKQLETILSVSGSSAITRNEYGVNIVDNSNIASSLVFKSLTKDKYDTEELLKAIDVTVIELKPNIPTPNRNLIPKPLYDEQVLLVEDLRKQVQKLNLDVIDLNSQIITLQSQVQTEINNRLSIEQINDVLVNQLETLTGTIEDFANQIAISLQKSVDESILRASLQSQKTGFKAQIEALIQQINSLNAIIEGLQSQLGAVRQQKDLETTAKSQGGDLINKVVSVNFSKKGSPSDPTMFWRKNNARDKAAEWKFGENLKITNNDLEPVQVSIVANFKPNQRWFSVPKSNFSITAGSSEEMRFNITENSISYGKRDNSVEYDSNITINITRADGTTETKSFPIKLGIYHPKSY